MLYRAPVDTSLATEGVTLFKYYYYYLEKQTQIADGGHRMFEWFEYNWQ